MYSDNKIESATYINKSDGDIFLLELGFMVQIALSFNK